MKSIFIKSFVSVTILAVMLSLMLLSGCQKNANSFSKAVVNNRYQDAIEYYNEFKGDTKEEIEAQEFLTNHLNESLEKYASGKINDTEFKTILITAKHIADSLNLTTSNLYNINDEYAYISASKEQYRSAENYLENEDYSSAISALEQVVTEDTENYRTAQEKLFEVKDKYRSILFLKADEYISGNDYEAALNLLYEGTSVLNNDLELTNKINNCLATQESYVVAATISEAEKKMVSNEYIDAITTLENLYLAYPDNTKLTVAITECKTKYVNYAITEAEATFSQYRDYDKAASILKMCQSYVGDWGDISEKITYYESYKPVSILDLNTFYENGDVYFNDGRITDNVGQTYEGYMYCFGGDAVYRTDKKYNYFSGRVIIGEQAKNSVDLGSIQIYGDGTLLFDSGMMGKGINPVSFEVDISNCIEVKIVFALGDDGCSVLTNAYFYK